MRNVFESRCKKIVLENKNFIVEWKNEYLTFLEMHGTFLKSDKYSILIVENHVCVCNIFLSLSLSLSLS